MVPFAERIPYEHIFLFMMEGTGNREYSLASVRKMSAPCGNLTFELRKVTVTRRNVCICEPFMRQI